MVVTGTDIPVGVAWLNTRLAGVQKKIPYQHIHMDFLLQSSEACHDNMGHFSHDC